MQTFCRVEQIKLKKYKDEETCKFKDKYLLRNLVINKSKLIFRLYFEVGDIFP